jgi:dolichyl-diphosphooligosaccharide--protein glycosyltransferase
MRVATALLAIAALALAVRALGLEAVFPSGGPVLLTLGDGAYHARLAAWACENFPSFLGFDPYLAGPLGSSVPWPPAFDLAVAAVARSLGGVERVDAVLAWSNPVLGAITVVPVYAAARAVGAVASTALGAATLYALFPIAAEYAAVGYGDHHAYVSAVGAGWLAVALAFVAEGATQSRIATLGACLVLARVAMAAGWAGSLLYLALADGLLLLACVASGGRVRLRSLALGALASAALLAPLVWRTGEPWGGPFSAITLSWLHVLASLALAVLALALAGLERWRPAGSAAERLARLAAVALALAGALLLVPAVRRGLAPALAFATLRDAAGAVTYEQMPTFPLPGRPALRPPQQLFGHLVWAVPATPLLALLAPARIPGRLLAAWSGVLAALAVIQVRYGNDLAPAAAVCFGLGLAALARESARRLRLRPRGVGLAVAALALVLVAAPTASIRLAQARRSLAWLTGEPQPTAAWAATPSGSLVRFAPMVREATPETPGYLRPDGVPEYGLLLNANLGHTVRHYARRPVAADNLWDKTPSFALATSFHALEDEGRALEVARELRGRFVLTAASPERSAAIGSRLDRHDGREAAGQPRLEHFRLVTEGPPGGAPLGDLFGQKAPPGTVPYKLFEIVEGAVLEVPGAPGAQVEAKVRVVTPFGRGFDYEARAQAGPDGLARLRVPYATRTAAAARPAGPWRLRSGSAIGSLDVSDEDVTRGAVLRAVLR